MQQPTLDPTVASAAAAAPAGPGLAAPAPVAPGLEWLLGANATPTPAAAGTLPTSLAPAAPAASWNPTPTPQSSVTDDIFANLTMLMSLPLTKPLVEELCVSIDLLNQLPPGPDRDTVQEVQNSHLNKLHEMLQQINQVQALLNLPQTPTPVISPPQAVPAAPPSPSSVVACANCFHVNPAAATICLRCATLLPGMRALCIVALVLSLTCICSIPKQEI
jgi:hypothetical protein